MLKASGSVLVLFFGAACGGGATGVSNQALLDAKIARSDALEFGFTQTPTPPTTAFPGAARYTGSLLAAGGIGNPPSEPGELRTGYMGDLVLDVNFDSGAMNGIADNFIELSDVNTSITTAGDAATGSVTILGQRNVVAQVVAFDLIFNGRIDGVRGSFLRFDDEVGTAVVFGENADAITVNTQFTTGFDGEPGFIGIGGIAGLD